MSHDQAKPRFSTTAAGLLLGRIGLIFLTAILLVAGWAGLSGLVVLISLFLAAAGLAKLWSILSLSGVHCHRSLTQKRIFPGETIEWALRLENRKPIPLPWIRTDEEIPLGLSPLEGLVREQQPTVAALSRTAALLWYRSITWRFRLQGRRRGYYPTGSTTVTSGDIFGLYSRSMILPDRDYIIVYPRIFPIIRIDLPSLQPMGDSAVDKRLFQDPARPIGVRDYQPFDSLKHIHWKASARRQGLQVKIFEPTTTFKVAIFLAIDSFQRNGAFDEDLFELGISTAATIAYHLSEQGSPVGLYVNTQSAEGGQGISILPGANRDQLIQILEALAKTTEKAKESFDALLMREREGLPAGTTLVMVCAELSEPLSELLRDMKESGHKVLLLLVGAQEINSRNMPVPWHLIRQPGDLGEVRCVQ
ncbi:MAG: DUF58 domain-containing protein [Desulfatiglandales bacterium]